MSDSSWVRLFAGQRSRTPTIPSPPALPSPTALLLDNSYFGGDNPCDAKPGSVRSLTPSLASPVWPKSGQAAVATGQDLLVNAEDQVQRNPRVDEMAEALRIAIMTRPAIATLGPEYTSYVLHLVEGFADVKRRLREMETLFDEAIALRKQESEAFTRLAERWDQEEMQYRAEIKRLELFIHDTSDEGVAAVLLARAGSQLGKKQLSGRVAEAPLKSHEPENHVARDTTFQRDADGMLAHAHGADQYSILTRRRNLDPRLDFEISERIRRLCAISPDDEGHHDITGPQNRPARTNPAVPRQFQSPASSRAPSVISSSSSSSSGSETGDDAGYAARYVTPDSPVADEVPCDLPSKRSDNTVDFEGSPELGGVRSTCGPTFLSPADGPSSSLPARASLHRREFSFAPGDDILGLVRLKSPTASGSPKRNGEVEVEVVKVKEEEMNSMVVPSVEKKPGDSDSV